PACAGPAGPVVPWRIEMLRPAAAQFAGEAIRRRRERRRDLAARDRLRRRDVAFTCDRLLDRQHRGERLVIDGDELCRRARLIERHRRDRRHRLALVFDHVGGERGVAPSGRRDGVPAGGGGGGGGGGGHGGVGGRGSGPSRTGALASGPGTVARSRGERPPPVTWPTALSWRTAACAPSRTRPMSSVIAPPGASARPPRSRAGSGATTRPLRAADRR